MLALSARAISRLEETDLPEQRASNRNLDRDYRLKELNGTSTKLLDPECPSCHSQIEATPR